MSSSRIQWVDYAKGLTIILVVFHHSVFRETGSFLYNETILYMNDLLVSIRMPLFFFISGLFIHKALASEFKSFIKFKVIHLLYLYVLWAVIRYLTATVPEHFITGGTDQGIYSIFYIFVHPPNTLWFIYALLIFMVITRFTKSAPAVTIIVSLLLFVLSVQLEGSEFIYKLLRFYPFFLLGYLTSDFTLNKAKKIKSYYLVFVMIYFVALISTLEYSWSWTPVSVFAFSCGGIIAGIITAVFLSRISAFSWLAYVGKNTLPIYVMHFLPVGVLRQILPGILPYQTLLATMIIVLSGVILPLIAMIMAKKLGMNWLFEAPFINGATKQPKGKEHSKSYQVS